MKIDEFTGSVRSLAKLGSDGETLNAIRATLAVLGEHLTEDEADAIAVHLPGEIGDFLRTSRHAERFGLQDFFRRVSEREGVDLVDAADHVRAVLSVVGEAISPGEVEDILSELPDEFRIFFRPVRGSAAGSTPAPGA
ncbi:MAG TPA: DUF2267 domain-containing protein [Dissulfurispiraceae bacterium]